MTRLIVSTIRLSSALTLYSVQRLEQGMNVTDGDSDLLKMFGRFGKTLDSLTDVLMKDVNKTTRTTFDSVNQVSHELIHRFRGGIEAANPREVLKASTNLLQETADVIAKWVSKDETQ